MSCSSKEAAPPRKDFPHMAEKPVSRYPVETGCTERPQKGTSIPFRSPDARRRFS